MKKLLNIWLAFLTAVLVFLAGYHTAGWIKRNTTNEGTFALHLITNAGTIINYSELSNYYYKYLDDCLEHGYEINAKSGTSITTLGIIIWCVPIIKPQPETMTI